jgi:DNA polymerase-3 subunit delta'
VGKGLAALAFARALLCERPTPVACETCDACKRAATFAGEDPALPAHPDLLIVERGLYRSVIPASEATGISIEQIRRIVLSRVGFPPHEGQALVCIVRGAEELTLAAANALLKTLEEPPARTFFVLLTSKPSRLLDTIRSRTLPVRFGALSDQIVAQLLQARGFDPELAPLAQGSMQEALSLADADAMAERRGFAERVLAGLTAPDLATALAFSAEQKLERQQLLDWLAYLGQVLSLELRAAAAKLPDEALRLSRRYEIVRSTLSEVERNVGPQLALEAMMAKLRRV